MRAKAERWLALSKKIDRFSVRNFHRTPDPHLIPNGSATRPVDICATCWLKQKTGYRVLESGAGSRSKQQTEKPRTASTRTRRTTMITANRH